MPPKNKDKLNFDDEEWKGSPSTDRSALPYHNTTVCFVVSGHRLICKIADGCVTFPGGEIGDGETPTDAVIRKLKEEIGAEVSELRQLSSLTVDWTENDSKRFERYDKFRGEETFFFVAFVSKLSKPASTKGDAWANVGETHTFTFPEVISSLEKADRRARGTNYSAFYAVQITCAKLIHMMIGVSKAQQEVAKEITGGAIPNVFTTRKYIK